MTELPTIWRGAVLSEWIDHNGHMNAGYYMVVFDDATGPWHEYCGMDDAYRSETLPAGLLQAQRDYFGAHTFERVDQPRGRFFHVDWRAAQRRQVEV